MKTIKHILFIKAQAPIGKRALLFSLLLLVKVWGAFESLNMLKSSWKSAHTLESLAMSFWQKLIHRLHSAPLECGGPYTYLHMQQQIKLGWALFVTYTIIQSIMRSEMCSLHLTHPSVHTWSSGQPTVQRPGSSRGLPVGAGIRTHNLVLPQVSSPTLYPLGQRLPMLVI